MEKNKIKDLKTGVIGVGSMGRNHARVYSKISNLMGVADPDENHGRKVAETFGVEWFKNYEDLLDHVDAVSIVTPTKYHKEVALTVANSGVNILVEKPLSGSVSDSQEIIDNCISNDVILSVGHIERHNPVIRFIKKSLDNDNFGELITISAQRLSPNPSRIQDVGVIFDLSVHDIDLMNYLFSKPPVSVFCLGSKISEQDNEENAIIVLDYENGKTGICQTSWLSPKKVRQIQLLSNNNLATLDFTEQTIDFSSSKLVDLNMEKLFNFTQETNHTRISISKEEPLENELIDFLLSISDKRQPLVSGNDGLLMVKIAEAAIESLKSGVKVSISQ